MSRTLSFSASCPCYHDASVYMCAITFDSVQLLFLCILVTKKIFYFEKNRLYWQISNSFYNYYLFLHKIFSLIEKESMRFGQIKNVIFHLPVNYCETIFGFKSTRVVNNNHKRWPDVQSNIAFKFLFFFDLHSSLVSLFICFSFSTFIELPGIQFSSLLLIISSTTDNKQQFKVYQLSVT